MKFFDLTEIDNLKTIRASVGDVINIKLVWNPSTGYIWSQTNTTAGELEEVRHEGVSKTPGAPVFVVFKFIVKKSGVIMLTYDRQFDNSPPVKWFLVDINV